MDDDVTAARDNLSILAVDGRLDGQLLPASHYARRQFDGQVAIPIGLACAAEEDVGNRRLPPPAPAADPRTVLFAKVVAAKLGRLEAVGGGEDVVLDVCVSHRAAEKVAHLDHSSGGLPSRQLLFLWHDRHLELGRAVGGDGKASRKVLVAKDGFDGIVAQRRPLGELQFAAKSAELVQFQLILIDLFPGGVIDGDLYRAASGQAITHVIFGADNALKVDGLASSVDGPVGVDVGTVVAIPIVHL